MGKIITFYSYKGGVGRTFAMANVGAILASWGRRVLCVDWDLEAPGLHEYFKDYFDSSKWSGGVADWVTGKNKDYRWQDYVLTTKLPNLSLLLAGTATTEYAETVQSIDWENKYKHGFGEQLEELRESWVSEYDFVLIDSRTGISDIGGICTVQMPDILVCLLTANQQNLRGTDRTLTSILKQRQLLPIDRPVPLIVPILSKLESRVEYERSQAWITLVAEVLGWTYANWLDVSINRRTMFERTRLPYIPFWSYAESLPAVEKGVNDPEEIGYRLASLAMLLANGLSDSDLFFHNRDSYMMRAWGSVPVAPDSLTISVQANALVVKAEGLTEEVGEIVCTIDCGRSASRANNTVVVNVTVYLNTNLTSRLVNDPWMEATATLEDLREASPPISISGRSAGANAVFFAGVRITLGESKLYRLAIRRIRCNANQLGLSGAGQATTVLAAVEFSDARNHRSKISQHSVTVALIQAGITIKFPKQIPPEGPSPGLPAPDPNEVASEIDVVEAHLGAFQNRDETGGDHGTRFMFRFDGIPNGTELFVRTEELPTAKCTIQRVLADATGGGGIVQERSLGWTDIKLFGTYATCVWEWIEPIQPGRLTNRKFRIGIKLVGPNARANAGAVTLATSFAPLSLVTTASSSEPIPRFADTSSVRRVFFR